MTIPCCSRIGRTLRPWLACACPPAEVDTPRRESRCQSFVESGMQRCRRRGARSMTVLARITRPERGGMISTPAVNGAHRSQQAHRRALPLLASRAGAMMTGQLEPDAFLLRGSRLARHHGLTRYQASGGLVSLGKRPVSSYRGLRYQNAEPPCRAPEGVVLPSHEETDRE